MGNKKPVLLFLIYLLAPLVSLNPLIQGLPTILHIDFTFILLFVLSLEKKYWSYLLLFYYGIFYDVMISPSLGIYLLIFVGIYYFYGFFQRYIIKQSALSAALFIFFAKMVYLPLAKIVYIFFQYEKSSSMNIYYMLSSIATGVVAFFLFDFFYRKDSIYQFER